MKFLIFTALLFVTPALLAAPTMTDLLAASQATDWRTVNPEQVLYMDLPAGRVVIELAPDFAPQHVANIKTLAREKYWDGLAVVRVQDNYVVQWADPNAEKPELKRKMKSGKDSLPPEFDHALDPSIPFTPLADKDVYAKEVGFSNGFPAARDKGSKKMWLLHCYGAVGAGRNNPANSGSGAELYAVIGHSPRHLDRNVTLVGRVLQGMELLSALPRGHGALGFYEKPEKPLPIKSIKLASEVPEKDRTHLEVLRTDTDLFKKLVEARRNRHEEWFHYKAARIEICNVPVPVREKGMTSESQKK